jgi:hypothetical protein
MSLFAFLLVYGFSTSLIVEAQSVVQVPAITFAWITSTGQFEVILNNAGTDSSSVKSVPSGVPIQITDSAGHSIAYKELLSGGDRWSIGKVDRVVRLLGLRTLVEIGRARVACQVVDERSGLSVEAWCEQNTLSSAVVFIDKTADERRAFVGREIFSRRHVA